MGRYIIKRLVMTLVVVIIAAWLIFTIMFFVPGDPARIMLGSNATYEEILAKREQLGLTGSYISRLAKYMYNCFIRLDFGTSWTYETPVFEQLVSRLPYTLIVTVSQMIFSLIIGVPLGIYAALHQNRWGDKLVTVFTMLGFSIPGFWLSLEMVILFSLRLGWLPAYGTGGIEYYILPVIGMSLGTLCQNARQTRSSVLEVMRADYVTTARAKGLSSNKVTMKHIMPNAMLPIITMVGGSLGGLIAGSAITEQTFSIPGIGLYMLTAMNNRDYPVVEAITILLAAITSICMLLTDLCYAAIDPRIKAQYVQGGSKKVKRGRKKNG
ncbi:MAG: ABC transporter permease [Lachnospiraceae bacterium]|nr:ABC transporter permease [Lachnospiraceae bacterium]